MPVRDDLGVDAQKKVIMRNFGISRDFATLLREAGPEEARWVILHEFETYAKWNERRRDYLLENFAASKLKRPRLKKTTEEPVIVQRHSQQVFGELLG